MDTFLVSGVALALEHSGAIPGEAMTFQATKDCVSSAGLFTRWIYVFNAYQPLALIGFGIQIAGEGSD